MTLEELNKDLHAIFETIEYEEGGSVYITRTDRFSDDLKVEFSIHTGVDGQSQLWEVQITGVRAVSITSGFSDKIDLFDEHPLLWPYNQFQTSLYFARSSKHPYQLFASIYHIHMQETKKWFPLEKFINGNIPIVDLCKSTSGLFASGPINLLEAYKRTLEIHEMNPTIVGGHNPEQRTNRRWVVENAKLKALVIGVSYVIGETFVFNRV
jgi:hypothetical protein